MRCEIGIQEKSKEKDIQRRMVFRDRDRAFLFGLVVRLNAAPLEPRE